MLDARPGGIIYRDIIPEYVRFARTIYEGLDFFLSYSVIFLISPFFKLLWFMDIQSNYEKTSLVLIR